MKDDVRFEITEIFRQFREREYYKEYHQYLLDLLNVI